MTNHNLLVCDGCGQAADTAHIARRLQRLEWTTRFRPVHINTLLLGGASPDAEDEFLYSPAGEFWGEALLILDAAGISPDDKTREAVHAEFQRAGFFLTHALECPLDSGRSREEALNRLLDERAPQVTTRIRRSLKPKRVALIAASLNRVADRLSESSLGCQVLHDGQKPYALDGAQQSEAVLRLRHALGAATAAR